MQTRTQDLAKLGGFSLVELIVAIMILTIGVFSLALLSGQVNKQTNMSELSVERSASLQAAIEEIRATPYADLGDGSATIDDYQVSWVVTSVGDNYKQVELVTLGPGLSQGRLHPGVADTFNYRLLARPDVQCTEGRVVGDDIYDATADDALDAVQLCAKYYPDDDDDADDVV